MQILVKNLLLVKQFFDDDCDDVGKLGKLGQKSPKFDFQSKKSEIQKF
jgi:hypothetical protein